MFKYRLSETTLLSFTSYEWDKDISYSINNNLELEVSNLIQELQPWPISIQRDDLSKIARKTNPYYIIAT